MRYWQALMLLMAAMVCSADAGFSFKDMGAVVLVKDDGGLIFGPPQGYRAEELDSGHHFAILLRLINENGPKAVPLSVDAKDADFRLTVLAQGKPHPLLVGDHWISDGENTVFLGESEYSEIQRVLSSRSHDSQISLGAVQNFVADYEQNWEAGSSVQATERTTIEVPGDSSVEMGSVNAIPSRATPSRAEEGFHGEQNSSWNILTILAC